MYNLLLAKRFSPLFITQFFGAFNDNILKNSIVILIMYNLTGRNIQDPHILVTIAAGLFILPFFLFSTLAGQIADKFDRSTIARITKIFEILIMCLATMGFFLESPWFLIIVLFCSGIHSAFFGPIKYSLLPQHLYPNELLAGNAYIEGGTFIAILFGTILGGILIIQNLGYVIVSAALLSFSIIGFVASIYIPKAPPPVPRLQINYNLVTGTIQLINYSRMNKKVIQSILCISWFWFIGAIFIAQLPTFAKQTLKAEARVVTLFFITFSIGIALGSYICNRILKGAIKNTLLTPAALGMSLFIIDLYFCSTNHIFYNVHGLYSFERFIHFQISWRILLDLLFIAICGGIYIVPLYTLMQHSADKNFLARIIATNNIFNAMFMVLSVIFTLFMLSVNYTISDVFLTTAIINLIVVLLIRRWIYKNN